MINHRGPEFAALLHDVEEGLRWALRTSNDILIFPCSGSGALEAAVLNLLSPGEVALFCTVGSFGDRWAEIGEVHGAEVVRLRMPDGEAIDPEDVERILAEHPDITTVFVTHNETSTGVTNDLPAIASVVKARDKLLAVDSVSGAGCLPLETDQLQLDVVITGSQKGWMAPPGVSMLAVSQSAYQRAAQTRMPRWYFDFARERSYQQKGQTLSTPAVSVIYAIQEGLAMMREEGLENVWGRHARVGDMVRAGVDALGLKLLAADGHRSNTVTAVHNPVDDRDAIKHLLTTLRTHHALVLAGGQGDLTGRIFRIGHLGHIDDGDVYSILATLELGLYETGMRSRVGLAVPAAQAVVRGTLSSSAPAPVG